jgi:signal transduction histidine kinase
MIKSLRIRKIIHFVLIALIILFQIGLIYLWNLQNQNKVKLTEAIEELKKPNLIMTYSNKASSHYFEADNYFEKYLQTYDKSLLNDYKNSLKEMTKSIDTLGRLTANDTELEELILNKQGVAVEFAGIKKQLDSLIDGKLIDFDEVSLNKEIKIPSIPENLVDVSKFKKFNPSNVLNSISYDTIYHKPEEPEKKGLFGRIGNALSGTEAVKKEKVEILITMKMGNKEIKGSIEEQLKELSNTISKFYENSTNQLQQQIKNQYREKVISKYKNQLDLQKKTYDKLKLKDKEIISINDNILSNSKNIINFYSSTANELNQIRQKKFIIQYNKDLEKQSKVVRNLLLGLFISSLLLLAYSFVATNYENKLQQAKIKAEQNDELKTRVLGMLSHEMRAPLNIISRNAIELKNNSESSYIQNNLESILFNSNSLNLTVNQILEYIKNENNELKLYNLNINLKSEIESVINSLKILANSKHIELKLNESESTNKLVWVDNVKIYQLFYNLIGNAIKFTQKGSIIINAELVKQSDKYKFLVSIKDTGEGISKEDLPNIFEKYFQTKSFKDNSKLGLGLGLSLCKEIVELYDGEIKIQSEVGKGSQVDFFMFFDLPHLENISTNNQEFQKKSFKGYKVAIVDDDIFIKEILKQKLVELDFEVFDFESSTKGLTFLNSNEIIF